MEEKMIYIPLGMFERGTDAIAKCMAIEAVVRGASYSIDRETLAGILGIDLEEDE